MNNENTKWYALRVVAGKEKKALENLETEIRVNDLDSWVTEILLPSEKKSMMRQGKRIEREQLTMPGYIFIQCHLIGELPSTIKNTNLVIGFTGDRNNNPIALRQSEVDRMIGRIEEIKEASGKITYMVGELVQILDGPFSSFKGDIVNVDEDKEEVEVNVKIFGRETPVKINYLQVDRV
jgi:transcriptional antiterminator NusG